MYVFYVIKFRNKLSIVVHVSGSPITYSRRVIIIKISRGTQRGALKFLTPGADIELLSGKWGKLRASQDNFLYPYIIVPTLFQPKLKMNENVMCV